MDRMTEFDMSLVQCGARIRRSPFYEAEQRYGPKGYTVYNHMLFPIRFDDLEAEFWHLVEHVTLWDVAVERCLEIAGPDGFRFAQLMTPRNLTECAVGQAKYVLVTAPDGGILNDPVLARMDENRFWLALASSDLLLYAKGLAANAGMDVELGEAEVSGIPVVVTRTGWSSEIGYEVYLCDSARGTDLWELIMEAGQPYGIRPTGPSDIRRIEGGILNWGADMTSENNPFELGLDRLADLDVDCVARDALRRIKEDGVRRRIVGVEIDGDRFPALNFVKWPVTVRGERVGKVTSAVYSPRLERNIGYAWVPVQLSELGTQLDLETEWGRRSATVVPMPFWDPEKQIPVS